MRTILGTLVLLVMLGSGVWGSPGGERFGLGCGGVCGVEQTVFDGVTSCTVLEGNIGADNDFIHLASIHVVIRHFDGDEDLGNILVPSDGVDTGVLISPHSEFETTFLLRPHVMDLGLPSSVLTLRVDVSGDVLFNALVTPPGTPSGPIEFASFGDITHVLAVNPATCAGAPARAAAMRTVIRHVRAHSIAWLMRHPHRRHRTYFHHVHG